MNYIDVLYNVDTTKERWLQDFAPFMKKVADAIDSCREKYPLKVDCYMAAGKFVNSFVKVELRAVPPARTESMEPALEHLVSTAGIPYSIEHQPAERAWINRVLQKYGKQIHPVVPPFVYDLVG